MKRHHLLLFFPLALSAICGMPVIASAHPHAWIDLRSTAILDDQNRLIALRETWLFDKFYTEFALHDFDPNKNGKLDPEELMELAQENMKNLKEFGYFTKIETPDSPSGYAFKEAGRVTSRLRHNQIEMEFTLYLDQPVQTVGRQVSYRIYDPSYYTAMLHEKKDALHIEGHHAADCQFKLSQPSPDISTLNLARALDKNAKAPPELGAYFAETVTLTCAKP